MGNWLTMLGLMVLVDDLAAKEKPTFQVVASIPFSDSGTAAIRTEIESYLAREIRSLGDAEYVEYTEHTDTDKKTFSIMVLLNGIKLSGGTIVYDLTFVFSEFMNQELMDTMSGSDCSAIKYESVEPLLHSTSVLGFYSKYTERNGIKSAIESGVAQFDQMALEPFRRTLIAKKKK